MFECDATHIYAIGGLLKNTLFIYIYMISFQENMPSELKFDLKYSKKIKNEPHILALVIKIQYVVEQVSIISTIGVLSNILIYFIIK